jgi:hypothetical protein
VTKTRPSTIDTALQFASGPRDTRQRRDVRLTRERTIEGWRPLCIGRRVLLEASFYAGTAQPRHMKIFQILEFILSFPKIGWFGRYLTES